MRRGGHSMLLRLLATRGVRQHNRPTLRPAAAAVIGSAFAAFSLPSTCVKTCSTTSTKQASSGAHPVPPRDGVVVAAAAAAVATELYDLTEFAGSFPIEEHLQVYTDVISPEEEAMLIRELNPILKQKPYEGGHWDRAIRGYRETEKVQWTAEAKSVLDRMYKLLPSDGRHWLPLHVLDLHSKGIIFPHVDSPKFSGDVVAGLSLYSDSMCTFQHPPQCNDDAVAVHTLPRSEEPPSRVRLYLPRRSFYVTSGRIRTAYAHGIRDPDDKPQTFKNEPVPRKRRISILYRDALPP